MNFKINQIPFSRYGSYLSFSVINAGYGRGRLKEGLYLRTIHGAARANEVFLLEPVMGNELLDYQTSATPASLQIVTDRGAVEICMAEADQIRIRGTGIGLKITSPDTDHFNHVLAVGENNWIINLFNLRIKFRLTMIRGSVDIHAPWNGLKCDQISLSARPDNHSGSFELALTELSTASGTLGSYSFDQGKAYVEKEFEQFISKMPINQASCDELSQLAWYVNWSCVVQPQGLFRRPAMLMSKNWMTNVWSWDHCFNCIALSSGFPELAWDQLMVMFDHQNKDGSLPDSINDCYAINNFYKPPIHGWTLLKLKEKQYPFSQEQFAEIYAPLCRWTDWWFAFMDDDHDGIPSYNHGNDSGWDNSTVFLSHPPIETPDLSAFLVLQTEALAYVASMLNRPNEALCWEKRSADLLHLMLEHFVSGDKMVALTSKSHEIIESESLLLYIPVLLGQRLPERILRNLVSGIRNNGFLTDFGLATESVKSKRYQSDGYWRGPIWAPSSFLIIDGLKAAGEKALAEEIENKFIRLIQKGGFAENFDAMTGEGLRDKAYTWTSSVFLSILENQKQNQ